MSKLLACSFLGLTVCLNTGASLLLKLATGPQGMSRMLIAASSMGCYGLAFLTYYASLRSFPVSVAYPVITGGAILMIVVMAAPLLGEAITGAKALGAALVIFGGLLLLRS